jgi:apolipoprotein N-acyltransferase
MNTPSLFFTALLAGVLHGISFALTPDSAPRWWLQIAALACLIWLVWRENHAGRAALAGFAFGMGWFGFGVHWVFTSLHEYGGMHWLLAMLAVLVFCAFLALYPALAAALSIKLGRYRQTRTQAPGLSQLLWFAALWGASEWLRGTVFTGFPWIASGYAHIEGPLAAYAPILGVYGLCTLSALLACSLCLWFRRALWPGAFSLPLVLVSLGLVLATQSWTQPQGQPLQVRLVQGNVAQDMKFQPERLLDQFRLYHHLATEAPADLIVLPETAFPVPIQNSPIGFFSSLADFARSSGSTLLAGIPLMQTRSTQASPDPMGQEDWYNAVIALPPRSPQQVIDHVDLPRYAKHHLVPFGEYIPWGFSWFVAAMNMPLGEFSRGQQVQAPFLIKDQRIGVNICYEDLFGHEIASSLQQPLAPTLLLNVSNIAWFGHSVALPQHLLASRLRAKETGRPMLRATNTGMTAVITPDGAIQAQLAPHTRATLVQPVQGYGGQTPYMRWKDWGFAWLTLILAGLGVVFARLTPYE